MQNDSEKKVAKAKSELRHKITTAVFLSLLVGMFVVSRCTRDTPRPAPCTCEMVKNHECPKP